MVNQSVIDSSVNLEQLKDIEDLIPNIDKAISEKVETFLDKSGDQPYAHRCDQWLSKKKNGVDVLDASLEKISCEATDVMLMWSQGKWTWYMVSDFKFNGISKLGAM